jgi:hypothetical protein
VGTLSKFYCVTDAVEYTAASNAINADMGFPTEDGATLSLLPPFVFLLDGVSGKLLSVTDEYASLPAVSAAMASLVGSGGASELTYSEFVASVPPPTL